MRSVSNKKIAANKIVFLKNAGEMWFQQLLQDVKGYCMYKQLTLALYFFFRCALLSEYIPNQRRQLDVQ